VVLHGRPRGPLPGLITAAYPDADVLSLPVDAGQSELHAKLAAHGPFDVLVDVTKDREGQVRRLRDFFFHLRAGGVYVVRDRTAGSAAEAEREPEGVGQLVARIVDGRIGSTPQGPARRDERRLSASIARVVLAGRHVAVTSRRTTLAKLRESEVNTVLEERPAVGRVLETRPPQSFRVRCSLRQSSTEHDRRMPTAYDAPAMHLREYVDVVCLPRQVVVKDNLLLPDTYRHHQAPRLRHECLDEVAPRFAATGLDLSEPESLPGSYFYLDSEFAGHFGHALTEQVSRLWGWSAAKQAFPDLKVLTSFRGGRRRLNQVERGLFSAVGIEPRDVVAVGGPTRVERLVAATPMFSQPDYAHPEIEELWTRVGNALEAAAPTRDYPERIFCSRRSQSRVCHNASEVEARFVEHGFHVVYPEDHPVAEQVAMFRRAKVVAGFAGSALFTLCLCDRPKRVVMISSEAYTARNEYMIAAVRGHELDIVWCRPDVVQPEGRWRRAAFRSAYAFDFRRDGAFLEEVLASA